MERTKVCPEPRFSAPGSLGRVRVLSLLILELDHRAEDRPAIDHPF